MGNPAGKDETLSNVLKFPKQGSQKPIVEKKKNRGRMPWSDYEIKLLLEMDEKGVSNTEKARILNKPLRVVVGKLNMLHAKRNPVQPRKLSPFRKAKPVEVPSGGIDENNPVVRAVALLNGRAGWTHGGTALHLDGRPAGLYAIIREANRILKENGMKQITGSPEWVV